MEIAGIILTTIGVLLSAWALILYMLNSSKTWYIHWRNVLYKKIYKKNIDGELHMTVRGAKLVFSRLSITLNLLETIPKSIKDKKETFIRSDRFIHNKTLLHKYRSIKLDVGNNDYIVAIPYWNKEWIEDKTKKQTSILLVWSFKDNTYKIFNADNASKIFLELTLVDIDHDEFEMPRNAHFNPATKEEINEHKKPLIPNKELKRVNAYISHLNKTLYWVGEGKSLSLFKTNRKYISCFMLFISDTQGGESQGYENLIIISEGDTRYNFFYKLKKWFFIRVARKKGYFIEFRKIANKK